MSRLLLMVLALVVLAASICGSMRAGVLADSAQWGRMGGWMLGVAAAAAAITVPVARFPVMLSVGRLAAMPKMLLTCRAITRIVRATAVTGMVPNEQRGFCLASFAGIDAVFGLGDAPSLVALVGNWLRCEADLPVAPAIVGVTAVGFWRAILATLATSTAARPA